MIIIIDNAMGNSGSVFNMIRKAGGDAVISSDPDVIAKAGKLLLPGVGAFDRGMENLKDSDFYSILKKKVLEEKTPFLGICLGMQLLFERSEEGELCGLGWLQGHVGRFNFTNSLDETLKIPHMGWNAVIPSKDNVLLPESAEEYRFYFVHSYHVSCENKEDILAISSHGNDFICAVQRDNIWGVQFHPEKSHRFGMELIKRFIEL